MKKLENLVWTSVITTIESEINNCKKLLEKPSWANDEWLNQRVSNLEIALKEFETQQLEDLLS